MKEETIEIPLVKATYEELQEVICELQVERIVKDKEIARLNNCINKIQKIINEYDFSYNDEWYEEPTSQELRDDYYAQSYIDIHRVYLILQELKEEGK